MIAWAGLGITSVLALAFAWATDIRRGGSPDASGVAFALLAVWGVTTLGTSVLTAPENRLVNGIMDSALAVAIMGSGYQGRGRIKVEAWKVAILVLLVIQTGAGFIYQRYFHIPFSVYYYTLTLNLAFLGQVASVCYPGGVDVARAIGRRLHRHCGGGIMGGPP